MLPLHGHLESLDDQRALLRREAPLNDQAAVVVVVIAYLAVVVAFFGNRPNAWATRTRSRAVFMSMPHLKLSQ